MKKILKALALLVVVLSLAAGGIVSWSYVKTNQALEQVYDLPPIDLEGAIPSLEIGKRIATIRNGCVDCHGADLSGNRVVDDPAFGVINGPNLTPAALKGWTDGQIARAIHSGVDREGRALILMPAHEYHRLSRDDLASVIAYLRTVPAVERARIPVIMGPIARILFATGKAKTLISASTIDHDSDFSEKPMEAPTRAFGKYLISTACIGCHRTDLVGGPIPGAPPEWLPAADLTKLKSWTKEQFVKGLREGVRPDGTQIRLPMSIAFTSQMTDTELSALWEFLKDPEIL